MSSIPLYCNAFHLNVQLCKRATLCWDNLLIWLYNVHVEGPVYGQFSTFLFIHPPYIVTKCLIHNARASTEYATFHWQYKIQPGV